MVAEDLIRYIVENNIDSREVIFNFESVFNALVDNSRYHDYKMTSKEIKIILRQSIYWLENHRPSVDKLVEFRRGQREQTIRSPGLMVTYRRDLMDELVKFKQDCALLDSIRWKG